MLNELILRGLVLANPIVPFFVIKLKVLSPMGNLFIILCIIPIEMLFISLILNFYRISIKLDRLLIAVSLANTATSIIGIPFVYNYYINNNYSSSGFLGGFLIVNFLIAWIFESVIYILFFQREKIPLGKIIQAAFAGNLVSYLMFAFVILPFSINSFSSVDTHSETLTNYYPPVIFVDKYRPIVKYFLENQQAFYYKNNRFTNNWKELGESEIIEGQQGIERRESQLPLIIEATAASFPFSASLSDETPHPGTEFPEIIHYNATIFVISDQSKPSELKFIKGICGTQEGMSKPKLVNGKFQCPSGSVDKSDEWGLR